mgnify:CR=1 FL=1
MSARRRDGMVMVSVSDQGIGIPPQELSRIFEPMYRGRHQSIPPAGGVGLGLSICKALVKAHGGEIWIESQEGKGSTCYFTLPVVES